MGCLVFLSFLLAVLLKQSKPAITGSFCVCNALKDALSDTANAVISRRVRFGLVGAGDRNGENQFFI